jgi:hypothetical protein
LRHRQSITKKFFYWEICYVHDFASGNASPASSMASGNDLWLDDLANWEANVGQAIKDLPRLEKALREQADVLRKHAARIRLYEQDVSMHEHALADYERGESGEELIQMAQVFGRSAEQHVDQSRKHEDTKRQHHELMASWRLLMKSLIPPQSDTAKSRIHMAADKRSTQTNRH